MPDPNFALHLILMLACLGSGMMAGLFGAFSTFMMRALSATETAVGMRSMQSINRVIVRPSFLLVFLGNAVLLLTSVFLVPRSGSGFAILLAATLIYIIACIASTIVFNIPLNNRLDAADSTSPEGEVLWQHYRVVWTRWNHVRTVACVITTLLVAYTLILL